MRKKLKLYFVRKELSKRMAELKEEQEIQKFFRNFFEKCAPLLKSKKRQEIAFKFHQAENSLFVLLLWFLALVESLLYQECAPCLLMCGSMRSNISIFVFTCVKMPLETVREKKS